MVLFRRKSGADPSAVRLEIILYHFVSDRRNDFTESGHTVTTEEFRRQLEYLAAHYDLIRLNDLAGLRQRPPPESRRPYAAVCFDDGYRCILDEAYPVLRSMRVPATMFVNPPVLGNRDLLWRDKIRYLMRQGLDREFVAFLRLQRGAYRFGMLEQIGFYKWSKNPKALRGMRIQKDVEEFFARKGIDPAAIAAKHRLFLEERDVAPREFLDWGNHTWSHPILTLLSAAEQRKEIADCHSYLAARGIRPAGLALPFSPFNPQTVRICRDLGYSYLLTVFEESNYWTPGEIRTPVILHRRMAPKDAGGFVSIV